MPDCGQLCQHFRREAVIKQLTIACPECSAHLVMRRCSEERSSHFSNGHRIFVGPPRRVSHLTEPVTRVEFGRCDRMELRGANGVRRDCQYQRGLEERRSSRGDRCGVSLTAPNDRVRRHPNQIDSPHWSGTPGGVARPIGSGFRRTGGIHLCGELHRENSHFAARSWRKAGLPRRGRNMKAQGRAERRSRGASPWAMVFRLIFNVLPHLRSVRLTHRKGCISGLPAKSRLLVPAEVFIHFELPFLTSSTIFFSAWFLDRANRACT